MSTQGFIAPSRRAILRAGAVTAAVSFDASLARAFAQGAGPIRIGVLNTFTKSVAIFGETTLRGIETWLEEHGGKLAGRPVEIIKEDDEFNPQVALQKVRKLVESDKVHVLLGPLGSHIATAMADYMKKAGTPWIITGAGATALTMQRIPNMYRATLTNWQVAHPMGTWAAKNAAKEVAIISSDFLAGHDVADAFKETFQNGGGRCR